MLAGSQPINSDLSRALDVNKAKHIDVEEQGISLAMWYSASNMNWNAVEEPYNGFDDCFQPLIVELVFVCTYGEYY